MPGLRRSEVADLAGVSVEYYAQLERGNLAGVSESVLDALARALQLDEAEQAAPDRPGPRRRPGDPHPPQIPAAQIRPSVARLLD